MAGKETKAVTVREGKRAPKDQSSVDAFIEKAIASNAPVETMERFFALRERALASQAKAEFVHALAQFQEECPVIKKTKAVMNKDGRSVRFKYAPIDSVIEQIKKPLSKAEFSYTWDVVFEDEHMKVTCKLTHVLGHFETSTFEIPIVQSEFMTKPQSYATAQTFAKRYTLLNVLGIATADEDTDATDSKKEAGALSQKSKIMFLLRELKQDTKDKKKIEEYVKKYTSLDLVDENFETIIERLENLVQENHES